VERDVGRKGSGSRKAELTDMLELPCVRSGPAVAEGETEAKPDHSTGW
jgi:hypothetical protein